MCAYSHDAAQCNYSFLVKLHVPSKSPALHVEEVYHDYPVRYDRAEYPACMHMVLHSDPPAAAHVAGQPGMRRWMIRLKL